MELKRQIHSSLFVILRALGSLLNPLPQELDIRHVDSVAAARLPALGRVGPALQPALDAHLLPLGRTTRFLPASHQPRWCRCGCWRH